MILISIPNIIYLKSDIDGVGVEGGLGMGGQMHRVYRLKNTNVDKSMTVKGWLGGLGMGGQRYIDLIEDMDSVGSGGRSGKWEGKYIHIRQYGQI